MKANPFVFGAAVLAVFFGVIWGFQSAGVWSTSGKVDSSGKSVQPLATDVESIKGWMTLEQISEVYQVPLPELLAAVGLPADTPSGTAAKDLESDTFETDTLRTYLQSRMDGTYLTASAGEDVAPADAQEPAASPATPIPPAEALPTAQATEHTAADGAVTGNTTFQDLYDWGLSVESVRSVLGMDPPDSGMLIRQFAVDNGLAFSDIKTGLQAEVDKLK